MRTAIRDSFVNSIPAITLFATKEMAWFVNMIRLAKQCGNMPCRCLTGNQRVVMVLRHSGTNASRRFDFIHPQR